MRALMIASLGAIAIASPTVGEDSIPWQKGEVEGWMIAVDPSIGNGCFIASIFDGDTTARIGFHPNEGSFYFQIGDADWRSIEAGKEYDIELQMGRETPWTATAVGYQMGELATLTVFSGDAAFVQEFASQHYIRVWYENEEIANLSLRGSAAAISEMLNCQQVFNEYGSAPATPASGDPFSKRTQDDPFSR